MPTTHLTRLTDPDLSPSALAATLAAMAGRLAEAMPNVADERTRRTFEESLGSMRAVCSSLRAIDLYYEPEHARQFTRHGLGLRRVSYLMSGVVGELVVANQRATARLNEHIAELEKIAGVPGGEAVADRLSATIAQARRMAAEMHESFSSIATRVSRATEHITALETELESAREKAFLDALTRVHSRSAMDERLEAAIREGEANGPWCFLLIAVDGFERLVESHDRVVGDALLFKVARTIEGTLPQEEGKAFLGRYGGEEFALLLARAGLAEAQQAAETIRSTVAATKWQERDRPERGVVHATVSIGVTQYKPGDTAQALVARAARVLQQAGAGDRDRVVAG